VVAAAKRSWFQDIDQYWPTSHLYDGSVCTVTADWFSDITKNVYTFLCGCGMFDFVSVAYITSTPLCWF